MRTKLTNPNRASFTWHRDAQGEVRLMLVISAEKTYNQRLIEFIRSHDTKAYANAMGTVTMENRFFNAPSEWVNVATFNEARIELNY